MEEGTQRLAERSAGRSSPARADTLPPTAPEEIDPAKLRRARAWRRAGLVVLAVVVLLGLTQRLGLRTGTVATSAEGYDVAIDYPAATRAGLAVTWSVRVTADAGFDGPVRVTLPTAYLGAFDWNAIHPEPDSMTWTDGSVVWTFERPPGETFEATLDARTQPSVHWGVDATTRVDVGERTVAVLTYRTEVMP